MLTIVLDGEAEQQLLRYAGETGRKASEIAQAWLDERLLQVAMMRRIDAFATLSPDEREELRAWAWDRATGAQLLAIDAEDGGYDWGPAGPPVFND